MVVKSVNLKTDIMVYKGDIVVRIKRASGASSAIIKSSYEEGYIFKAIRSSKRAYYEYSRSIHQDNFRKATDYEVKYFLKNPTITNISEIPVQKEDNLFNIGDYVADTQLKLTGYIVYIGDSICTVKIDKIPIGCFEGWGYRVFNRDPKRKEQYTAKEGETFWNCIEQDLVLINKYNKQDEVSRKIAEQGEPRVKGSRTNSQKIKVASASRPVGSRITNSRRRSEVRYPKISGSRLQLN
jgi:hypothetical protein